jgi:hypothetical protein
VGHYRDRNCRVGPISDPEDLVRIQKLLVEHKEWIDPSTPGIIRTEDAILEPTIICKPLIKGGNFTEVFAPIIFVQKYEQDEDLIQYFENPYYARNAMYISLYGKSKYITSLVEKPIEGKIIHDSMSILHNIHLHMKGVERGTQPYGGYGYSASSISINGKIICKPTLPQRDIFEWVVKQLLHKKTLEKQKAIFQRARKITHKDVKKLLGIKNLASSEDGKNFTAEISYIDSHAIKGEGRRYIRVRTEHTFHLLNKPNIEYIAALDLKDIQHIRTLRAFLQRHHSIALDEFSNWLYGLVKKPSASENENRIRQLNFFKNIYQLLLGKDSGPRLAQFILDVERNKMLDLINV